MVCISFLHHQTNYIYTYNASISWSAVSASGKSFLLPRTSTGMFTSWGFSKRFFSSVFAASNLSRSAASTTKLQQRVCVWDEVSHSTTNITYTIAFTPRQYRSHMLLKRGWPPISHNFMVTLPFVTFRILKPTVGIASSMNCPDYNMVLEMCFAFVCSVASCIYSYDIHKSSFTTVLKTNQGQLHLSLRCMLDV